MNPFEMVAIIVVAVMLASVLRAKYGHTDAATVARSRRARKPRTPGCSDEVKQLKDRIHVLERITVEKENSLAREIESLRDR